MICATRSAGPRTGRVILASMAALSQAIEELYLVFGSYRVGKRVQGCPCCTTLEQEQQLVARPLRTLTGDDLGSYAMSALYTWGSERDFKHFLPRILQLLVEGTLWVDVQSVYAKLPYARWEQWPAPEQSAIQRFTLAWFADLLGRRSQVQPEDLLECAGMVGCDLADYIALWEAEKSPVATTYLAELVSHRSEHLASGTLPWIWWQNDALRTVPRWLLSGRAKALLATAFACAVDHPDAGNWALAHDILEALSLPARP